jgi:uncharacterized alkaline shock family protein YloU
VDRLELARHLGSAATAVPNVVELNGGRSGALAEYGVGGSVSGVSLDGPDEHLQVTVSITGRYSPGLDLERLADEVRRAVQRAADEDLLATVERVDVVVADLLVEEATP